MEGVVITVAREMKVAALYEIVVVLSVDQVDSLGVVLILGKIEEVSYAIGLLANVVTAPKRLAALLVAYLCHGPCPCGAV